MKLFIPQDKMFGHHRDPDPNCLCLHEVTLHITRTRTMLDCGKRDNYWLQTRSWTITTNSWLKKQLWRSTPSFLRTLATKSRQINGYTLPIACPYFGRDIHYSNCHIHDRSRTLFPFFHTQIYLFTLISHCLVTVNTSGSLPIKLMHRH